MYVFFTIYKLSYAFRFFPLDWIFVNCESSGNQYFVLKQLWLYCPANFPFKVHYFKSFIVIYSRTDRRGKKAYCVTACSCSASLTYSSDHFDRDSHVLSTRYCNSVSKPVPCDCSHLTAASHRDLTAIEK